MSSTETQIRSVSPVLAGFVAIVCFGCGGGLGGLLAGAVDAPTWLAITLYVAGSAAGYLLGRTVLRWLYTPR